MEKVGTDSAFTAGRSVGELARELFDPEGSGQWVDVGALGVEGAIQRTRELLTSGQPVFEAGFAAEWASAFVDVPTICRDKSLKSCSTVSRILK